MIDILQNWNFEKKFEAYCKSTFQRKDRKMISAIDPMAYKKRFDKNIMRKYFNYNPKKESIRN